MFLDLVGYTALTAQRGDDQAADAALALYGCVRPLLAAHGAEEVKTIGDAMMLRCAAPASAVRLGLRIVSCVDAEEALPSVRVGIHTGPAVQRERDWYGSTVNVAARLCSAAGGCEVLVSDATRLEAERVREVEFADRRLHWLKNVTEPVTAWVAVERPARPAAGLLGSMLRNRPRAARAEGPWSRAAQRLKALGEQMGSCPRAAGRVPRHEVSA
jgi:class 3 adenylate cyclase